MVIVGKFLGTGNKQNSRDRQSSSTSHRIHITMSKRYECQKGTKLSLNSLDFQATKQQLDIEDKQLSYNKTPRTEYSKS